MLDKQSTLVFKAILFDVDDTLFDRRAAFKRWSDHYISHVLGVSSEHIRDEIYERISEIDGSGYGSKKELLEELLQLYPPPSGINYPPALGYSDFVQETILDNEAADVLLYLESINFPFGVVTNGGPRQVEKVQRLGLSERVKCLFVSETFGSAKPDQTIFIAAANCLGYLPHEIVFVGDHPINDILGAHSVGMQTAWLPNNQSWPDDLSPLKPDHTLHRLSDLLTLLQ